MDSLRAADLRCCNRPEAVISLCSALDALAHMKAAIEADKKAREKK
jgi:hypothetical protein